MGEHRQHKGLNNRADNSHLPTQVREKAMRRFKSARHLQRFASVHDQVVNRFIDCRNHTNTDRGSTRWRPRVLTNPSAAESPADEMRMRSSTRVDDLLENRLEPIDKNTQFVRHVPVRLI
jgi:hypothetical protein